MNGERQNIPGKTVTAKKKIQACNKLFYIVLD